jgi:poly [ADP-ribose] polymerase
LEEAKKEFLKKHTQKSKTYRNLTINYEKVENKDKKPERIGKEKELKQKCSLNRHVQSLINLIYNKKILDEQILEIGYDTKKLPLGKLGKSTILKGFEVLKRIEDVLNDKSYEDIYDLSSLYYSFIPHCFGFQNMKNFVIDSLEKLKLKVSNLESLSDIEIATKILDVKLP